MANRKSNDQQAPIYPLGAFSEKATWAEFYIENFTDHVTAHPFVGNPHKHDFYLILFVRKGSGTHTIDFTTYPVEADTIFLMTPGQVHSWTLSPQTDGYVVFFTRSFYQMQQRESNLLEFPFFHSLSASPVVHLKDAVAIDHALAQMVQKFQASKPDLRLLRAYLDVLLLEASAQHGPLMTSPSAVTLKLRKLEQLIEQNFLKLKKPADYADKMNLASTYLNSICKASLGSTLSKLILSRILLEARRLLVYSELNINGIASQLGFRDASYFVRWFKKNGGVTPDEFRKAQTDDR